MNGKLLDIAVKTYEYDYIDPALDIDDYINNVLNKKVSKVKKYKK